MPWYEQFRKSIAEEIPIAIATVISGPLIGSKLLVYADGRTEGDLASDDLTTRVVEAAVEHLTRGIPGRIRFDLPGGPHEVFLDVYPVQPRLVIVGASHAAEPLTAFAAALGFRVTVVDARAAFAIPERFPAAEQVLKGWPQDVLPDLRFDESTYVVLLSHDSKFDVPTLEHVLPTSVPYIGAIGSRRTQLARFERLHSEGFTDNQLSRIYGPVGLDLGARTPEETALAILAEIVAVRHQRPGGFLRDRSRQVAPA